MLWIFYSSNISGLLKFFLSIHIIIQRQWHRFLLVFNFTEMRQVTKSFVQSKIFFFTRAKNWINYTVFTQQLIVDWLIFCLKLNQPFVAKLSRRYILISSGRWRKILLTLIPEENRKKSYWNFYSTYEYISLTSIVLLRPNCRLFAFDKINFFTNSNSVLEILRLEARLNWPWVILFCFFRSGKEGRLWLDRRFWK